MVGKLNMIILSLMVFLITSCSDSPDSIPDVTRSYYVSEDGYTKTRNSNGIYNQVTLLPTSVNIREEMDESELEEQKKSIFFLLEIGYIEDNGDIMRHKILSYEDLQKRTYELNFSMKERLRLNVGGLEISPSLCVMDNSQGLRNFLRFNVAFTPSNIEGFPRHEEVDMVYSDDFFDTGINHFVFSRQLIEEKIIN